MTNLHFTYDLPKRRNSYGEFVVRGWIDGKRETDLDYHTTDWKDACETLADLQAREEKRRV